MLWLLCTLLETISVPCRFRVEKLASLLQSTCLTSNTTQSILDSFGTTCGCYPYVLIRAHHRARFAVGALPSETVSRGIQYPLRYELNQYTYYSKWKHSILSCLSARCQIYHDECALVGPSVRVRATVGTYVGIFMLSFWKHEWNFEVCISWYPRHVQAGIETIYV